MSYITYDYKCKFLFKDNFPWLKIAIYQVKRYIFFKKVDENVFLLGIQNIQISFSPLT